MASFKLVKELSALGSSGKLRWGIWDDGSSFKQPWKFDTFFIRLSDIEVMFTSDPEIKSMCRIFSTPDLDPSGIHQMLDLIKEGRISTIMKDDLSDIKYHGRYVFDNDTSNYLGFASSAVSRYYFKNGPKNHYEALRFMNHPLLIIWDEKWNIRGILSGYERRGS